MGDGEWNVFDYDGGRDDIVVLGGYGWYGVVVLLFVGWVGYLRVLVRDGVSVREVDRSVVYRWGGRCVDDVYGYVEFVFGVRWLWLVRVCLVGVGGGCCGNGGGWWECGGWWGDVMVVFVWVVLVLWCVSDCCGERSMDVYIW